MPLNLILELIPLLAILLGKDLLIHFLNLILIDKFMKVAVPAVTHSILTTMWVYAFVSHRVFVFQLLLSEVESLTRMDLVSDCLMKITVGDFAVAINVKEGVDVIEFLFR